MPNNSLQAACDAWNAKNPIGTLVLVWPGAADVRIPGKLAVTAGEAIVFGRETPGVYVNPGGFIALTHMRPADPPKEPPQLPACTKQPIDPKILRELQAYVPGPNTPRWLGKWLRMLLDSHEYHAHRADVAEDKLENFRARLEARIQKWLAKKLLNVPGHDGLVFDYSCTRCDHGLLENKVLCQCVTEHDPDPQLSNNTAPTQDDP